MNYTLINDDDSDCYKFVTMLYMTI